MPGGRSMYELSQGAQGFQADSRTNLTNGAGMHMLMPVQPTYTTILDIVNETRLPYFRFLDLPPELRCMVYGFYFVDPHPPYNSPYADYDPLAPSFIQALTLVSQFIRYENLLHLYRGRPNAAFWPPDLTRIDLTFSLHLTIRTMHRPTLRTKRMRDMAMLLEPSPAAPLRSLHTVEIRMTLCPGVLMPIVLTIVPGTLRVSVSVRRDFDKEVSHPPDRTCGRMRFMCDACALRATCYAGITARLMGLGEGESLCLIRCALLAWRMEQIDWTRFREGGHGFPAQPGLP
nr:hypothetical protein B0A51_12202 [Rachicladosporium sp. CCFEE 5018]